MNKYVIFLFLKFNFLACIVFGQASKVTISAETLSLDSCYELARNNYPMIKQNALIENSKEFTLSNASKAYLPQVSITAIGGYILGGLPSNGTAEKNNLKFIGIAQVNQTIWDGGATKTQKKIIEASAQSEMASLDVALFDLRSRINQLYFGILMVDEQLIQLAQRDTVLNNSVNRIKQMNDNGLSFKIDLDEIQVEQIKLSQQKREFKYARQGYVQMLSLLIGRETNNKTKFEKPHFEQDSLELKLNRPELSLYESQRNLINAQAGMQRVSLMPKVGLMGIGLMLQPGLGLGASSISSLGVAGLSASWNISGYYKNNNEKKLNQVALDKVNLQQETFLFNTKLQTAQTQLNIEKQKEILSEDEQILILAKNIREGYQLKYNNGMCSMLDLLNATQREAESKTQKALHEMQLLMSLYEYKTTTGN